MKMQTLALIGMVTTAVGGVAWVFLYPLLSGERKDEDIYQALEAGAAAYLLKDTLSEDLVNVIREVHTGNRPIPPDVDISLIVAERTSNVAAALLNAPDEYTEVWENPRFVLFRPV